MNDAFDRLYTEFSGKGSLPVDDEFKAAASQYFESFIGSVDAPAAHDHYFYGFLPTWNFLQLSERLGIAERLWELAFEPVRQWEQLTRANRSLTALRNRQCRRVALASKARAVRRQQ